MPVKAIKNIVKKELESFRQSALYGADLGTMSGLRYFNDASKEIFDIGYETIMERLNQCNDHESLDNLIGELYKMSLQDWIDSL